MKSVKLLVPLGLVLMLVGLWGCSTTSYTAEKHPMMNLKGCDNATEHFEYTMIGNFYICGLAPSELDVNLTKIAQQNGAPDGLCDVVIEEKMTFLNGLIWACTIGIYVPRTITITGKKIGG